MSDTDHMCPNCQTPWKCNGPHLEAETPYHLSGQAAEEERQAVQADQDENDGAALRRLREALPEGYGYSLNATQGEDLGPYSIQLWDERVEDVNDPMPDWYPTIAEAADKCREALP